MTVGQVTLRTTDKRRTLTAWLGSNEPTLSDGVGGWTEIQRPRKPGIVEWTGTPPLKASLELLLDGYRAGRTILGDVATCRAFAPLRPTAEPPVFTVTGHPAIPGSVPWTAQGLDFTDWLIAPRSARPYRVTATFTLVEYRVGDVVTHASPAARSRTRHGSGSRTGAGKARTYTVRKGDTLGSIAAKLLGSASRWTELKLINGIRDPNHLKVGYVMKLPTS